MDNELIVHLPPLLADRARYRPLQSWNLFPVDAYLIFELVSAIVVKLQSTNQSTNETELWWLTVKRDGYAASLETQGCAWFEVCYGT